MIISASRRTDIPAFFSDWFIERLRQGYALIPNPRNRNRLGKVEISPKNVDCIVFWTKNPIPMFNKLETIGNMGYPYYFQFTLTPYGKNVERHLPSKSRLIQSFIQLSERTSADRVIWRYDPIIVDDNHPISWHVEQFSKMCEKLQSYTRRCVLSFVDPYKSIANSFRALTNNEMIQLASHLSKIAKQQGITLSTCAENIDLSPYHITHNSCIDKDLIEKIIGIPLQAKIDKNQRAACCCIESVDIGVYDTCANGCAYCYAVSSQKTVLRRIRAHDPKAPMITGYPRGDEIVTDRTTPSQKINQLRLF